MIWQYIYLYRQQHYSDEHMSASLIIKHNLHYEYFWYFKYVSILILQFESRTECVYAVLLNIGVPLPPLNIRNLRTLQRLYGLYFLEKNTHTKKKNSKTDGNKKQQTCSTTSLLGIKWFRCVMGTASRFFTAAEFPYL